MTEDNRVYYIAALPLPLEDITLDGATFKLMLPEPCQVLAAKEKDGVPVLYIVVCDEAPKREVGFKVYGTGNEFKLPDINEFAYVDTVLLMSGELEYHIFKEIDDDTPRESDGPDLYC